MKAVAFDVYIDTNKKIKIRYMVHELKYDDQNEVGVLTFKSNMFLEEVEPAFSLVREMMQDKPYRQMVVVMDTKYTVENRETREAIAAELGRSNVTETAFVGGGAANRMITKVLMKTGVVKMNGDFFNSEEEAIKWLKSKR